MQGTCHLTNPTGDWCKLFLGDTIQVDHTLWLDSLHIMSPKSGKPALGLKQLFSKLWMTNVTMNGNGSPNAAGIDLNGHLFAESTCQTAYTVLTSDSVHMFLHRWRCNVSPVFVVNQAGSVTQCVESCLAAPPPPATTVRTPVWVIAPDLIEQIWCCLSNFQIYYPNNSC